MDERQVTTRRYRLGIDIGGTFTDVTLLDSVTGAVQIGKVSSTPADPSRGFIAATERMLQQAAIIPADVEYLVHATTVATNAIIEGKMTRTGFITTEGFRDMLEIARQTRPTLYDLHFEKAPPLIPRYHCIGVPQRMDARGQVLLPLDEDAVREAARTLRADGADSVAVCFLHSYVNAKHEQQAYAILRETFPDIAISISSDVAPEFREYFRASTTVINAGIRPIVARYLQRIEERLREAGVEAELLVMQSNGGVLSFASASERPVFMVESGPAAGVVAAAHLSTLLDEPKVVSFDMGGTTAKVGLILDSQPHVTRDYEVGAIAKASGGGARGGYPIRTPVIDLVEIGAGGGSIAWIDSGGGLRVGPRSAGADPGPVCYGNGGVEPTVTDANLVLGRLNADYFLGGEIALDVDRARAAIRRHCAEPLGMDVVESAHAIVEIANAAMVNALRLVLVQRGYDPRDFTLIAFGGAGPVHANRLAAETEIPTVIIPMSPGTTSALGLLVTDLRHDFSTTLMRRMDGLDPVEAESTYRQLEARGRADLARDGIAPEAMRFSRQMDLRYIGQGYELTLPLPTQPLDGATCAQTCEQFHREHDRAYGHSAPDEPVELVALRVAAVGTITKPRPRDLASAVSEDPAPACNATRDVYFAETGGYVACTTYDRYRIGAGMVIDGPAIVEELDSTTVIHPGYRAVADRYGDLILRACQRGQ